MIRVWRELLPPKPGLLLAVFFLVHQKPKGEPRGEFQSVANGALFRRKPMNRNVRNPVLFRNAYNQVSVRWANTTTSPNQSHSGSSRSSKSLLPEFFHEASYGNKGNCPKSGSPRLTIYVITFVQLNDGFSISSLVGLIRLHHRRQSTD